MAVNWLLGMQQGPDAGQRFQTGFDAAQQRQQAEALRGQQQELRQAQMAEVQSQTRARDLETHRDTFIIGAALLRNVPKSPDPNAAYQRALAAAREYGLPMDNVPQTYDPEYVRTVIERGAEFQAIGQRGQQPSPPNIQREVDYYRSIGQPQLADQLLQRHAEGPPVVANNGDGTFTIVPRSQISGGGQAPRVLTDDDIRALDQGGAGQPGPQTFP